MFSVPLFGEGGAAKTAAPAPHEAKRGQGLFGAIEQKTAAPLPRPEQFGRR
jgi:hypothetical protein